MILILTGKTEGLGEKSAPVPLFPPQIPLDWPGREPSRRGERPTTNRLSHGTAQVLALCLTNLMQKDIVYRNRPPSYIVILAAPRMDEKLMS
jgi:hypothetical protein